MAAVSGAMLPAEDGGLLLAVPVAEIVRILVTELLAYRRTTREEDELAASPPYKPIPQPD